VINLKKMNLLYIFFARMLLMINLKKINLPYTIFVLSSYHHVDITILVFLVVMILLSLFFLAI